MVEIDALISRIPKALLVAIVGTAAALGVGGVALYRAQTEAHNRCVAGNDFRADVRELAGTTASGFTGLADILVGDDERTPEEQAAIDRARALYQERVVDPIEALADDGGTLGPRNC